MENIFVEIKPKFSDFNQVLKSEILKKIKKRWYEVKKIAQKLKASTDYQTCKNIFDFTLNNVDYQEDAKDEVVRSPSHILNGYNAKIGDCKSHSILNCSLLLCLDKPSLIKFVGYKPNSTIVNHVYCISLIDDKPIILDSTIKMFDTIIGQEKYSEIYQFLK